MSKELTERLRGAVQQLRRTPMPIAEVAPMLNQAADEIERLQRELDEARKDAERFQWLLDNCNLCYDESEHIQLVVREPTTGENWKETTRILIDAARQPQG